MNSRDRRALTLGAIIAVPSLLIPGAVKPYLTTLSSYRQEISDERDRLASEQRLIAGLPALPATRQKSLHQLDSEVSRLFQGSTDLAATGDLVQYIGSAAQATGVRLLQTETRPARLVLPDLQALQVAVRAEGDLDGILRFVHQLETGDKLVRVGDLSIEGGRGTPSGGRQQSPSVEVLSVSASMYGYRLTGTKWQSVQTAGTGAPTPFTRDDDLHTSLETALNHDLFSATRTRPPISYQAAMTQSQNPQPVQIKTPPPRFHLVGTAASAGSANFAMIQQDGAHATLPRAVSVGQELDGYTLRSVQRDTAVFFAPDGTRFVLTSGEAGETETLYVTGQGSAAVQIEKDSTGNMHVAKQLAAPQGQSINFSGPSGDSVYAQVEGPPGWGGDQSKFLLAADGKGNCCKTIPMPVPGNYGYKIWDKGTHLLEQGTIVLEP